MSIERDIIGLGGSVLVSLATVIIGLLKPTKISFFSHPICILEDERERDGKEGKERVF